MADYAQPAEKKPELRIVLVGKTGVGKSAVGNRILGRKAFESRLCLSSVTSVCKKEKDNFAGVNLTVIDTPGLFGTDKTNEEVIKEIAKGICMAAPGPHVFLIVLQLTRFTPEEKETVEIIQKMFGKEAAKYTMILFTQGDELKGENATMEGLLENYEPLKHFVNKCATLQKFEDKYHVFDNKVEDSAQVRGLVQKIQGMVRANGRHFYTNALFEEAQRAKQEEMERLITENPHINHGEARRQAESENNFIRGLLRAAAGAAATIRGAIRGIIEAAETARERGCIIQ